MRPLELEPEIEALIAQLAPPGLERMQGATAAEVEQIESLAGRPLPPFYRWFLLRMGRDMGPFSFPTLDFSAATIISSYTEDELFEPGQRYHMIAFENDDVMPLHLMYDFDAPARGDALVVKQEAPDGRPYPRFETLREMFAWSKFLKFRVQALPQRCNGLFVKEDGAVSPELGPLMEALGLVPAASVPTGPLCALYDGRDVAMVAHSTPGAEPGVHAFSLGGRDAGTLRRLLGEITNQSSLSVEVKDWTPVLK